jgi:antitoxin YefM
MQTLTFSQTRQYLANTMDDVVSNHTPVVITRQNKESVVMISLEDFKAMEETMYLMQSVNNAERLNRSIRQLEAGYGSNKELIEV